MALQSQMSTIKEMGAESPIPSLNSMQSQEVLLQLRTPIFKFSTPMPSIEMAQLL